MSSASATPETPSSGRTPPSAADAARLSLFVGAAVFALKYAAWHLTDSVALLSDAMESVVNVVAAGAALIALKIAQEPADENHPYGHSKAEYFSAVLEGILIVIAATAIIFEAWQRFQNPTALTDLGPGLVISFIASGTNALLAVYLLRRGRALRSPALLADGQHIRADVVTSIGVWVGVGLAWTTGWWMLDPLLAAFVAVNVVRTGWHVVRDSIGGLMDESLLPAELDDIHAALEEHLNENALEIHDLKTRRSAARAFIQFHLVVPGEMSVRDAHDLCDQLEEVLDEVIPGSVTEIHVEPELEAQNLGRIVGPTH
ncbi:MAG: cation diffusion facilitator family transporter [Planctomycetota bacterium]|jgi:cation diffusion facilitator family transporter